MMIGKNKLGRRCFLRLAGAAGTVLLAACGAPAAPTPAPASSAAQAAPTSPPAAAAAKPAEATKPAVAPPAASAAKPASKSTVLFWYQTVTAQYEEPVRKIIRDEFNEANKDRIEMTFEYIADWDRVNRTAVAAGAAADIIFSNGPTLAIQYAQANQLVPLDGYSADFKWKQNMFDWAYLQGTYEGKLISLQQSVETMCLYYNKTMFAKNGWKVPTNGDEYTVLGKEMQKANIIPFAHGNFAAHWLSVAYNNYAGATNMYNALLGKKKWTDPEFVESIQYFKNLHDTKFMTDGKSIALTSIEARPLFYSQKAAMMWQGTWTLAPLFAPSPEFEWDWAPIGGLSKYQPTNPYMAGSGGSYSMVKTAKFQDAAAQVLNWFYSDRKRSVRLAVAQPGEFVAPLRFEASDFPSTIDPRHRGLMNVLAPATDEKTYGFHVIANFPVKTLTMMQQRWPDVLLGVVTPTEFQKLTNDLFEQELDAKQVPALAPR